VAAVDLQLVIDCFLLLCCLWIDVVFSALGYFLKLCACWWRVFIS